MQKVAKSILVTLAAATALQGCSCVSLQSYDRQVEEWSQHLNSGYAELQEQHLSAAEKEYAIARAQAERFGASSPQLAATLKDIGDLCVAEERNSDAVQMYDRSAKINLRLWQKAKAGGEDRVIASLEALTAQSKCNKLLGRLEQEQVTNKIIDGLIEQLPGDLKILALGLSERSRGIDDKVAEPAPLDIAGITVSAREIVPDKEKTAAGLKAAANRKPESEREQAQRAVAEERYSDAAQLYEKILARDEKTFGCNSSQLEGTLWTLSTIYTKANNVPKAEEAYKHLLEVRRKAYGMLQPQTAQVYGGLYALYMAARDSATSQLTIRVNKS